MPLLTRLSVLLAEGALLASAALLPPLPDLQSACANLSLRWKEVGADPFSISFTARDEDLAEALRANAVPILSEEYALLSGLLGEDPASPILVRLYPTELAFRCLNPTEHLSKESWHASVGENEIALVTDTINQGNDEWESDGLNILRLRMASLLARRLSHGSAPGGLTLSFGAYTMDLEEFVRRNPTWDSLVDDNVASWEDLWSDPDLHSQPELLVQGMSTVAYLVDVYGWDTFTAFLRSLTPSMEFHQALIQTYGLSTARLQLQWREYFPYYIEGRWRANALRDFDLSVFAQLIEQGAYEDALLGLKQAQVFLDRTGDSDGLVEAENLADRARRGIEAASLLRQARQALQDGDAEAAVSLSGRAEEIYLALQDQRRLAELDSYRARAAELLALQGELSAIGESASAIGQVQVNRLVAIEARLTQLGDSAGAAQARDLAMRYQQQQTTRQARLKLSGLVLALALLLHRILTVRREAPPESRLL